MLTVRALNKSYRSAQEAVRTQLPEECVELSSQPALHLRGIGLRPPPDSRVVHGQSPLGHELFHIPETQGESEIPAHAGDDNLSSKLPLPERRRLAELHPLTLPDLSH